MVLATQSEFAKDVLERRVGVQLTEALSAVYGREITIAVTVQPSSEPPSEDEKDGEAATVAEEPSARAFPGTGRDPAGSAYDVEPARLNGKYVFETFVIGASNRFAHAASVAVAETPAKAYNPLFVYGESGPRQDPPPARGRVTTPRSCTPGHMRVRYVNSEEFTNEFINSHPRRQAAGRLPPKRYREVDLLLVDDIQFLENKERTQEEFFHTFNDAAQRNSKQIVISSDRPTQAAGHARGPAAQPLRVGAHHRRLSRPTSRPGSPSCRKKSAAGRLRGCRREVARVHRHPHRAATSGSSRGR